MSRIIYNGRIYLGREKFCEALAIEGGRIVRTGLSKELLEEAPAGTEKIDAGSALVLPAFHDSHLHLMNLGKRAGSIECTGAKSIEEVIQRGRELIARLRPPEGTYVLGAGVNPDLFESGEKRDLRREDVDKISTKYPLILSRHCGHVLYCNSLALSLAGFSESAPEIAAGTIEKDKNGRPTGICREGANVLVRKPIPAPSREAIKNYITLAMQKAHSLGISSCGSYDSSGPDFENILDTYTNIYNESLKTGVPAVRVSMQCGISASEELLDAYLGRKIPSRTSLWEDPREKSPWGTFLKMGSIKLFADGTLGGHTAWMRQPYHDKPESHGIPVLEQAVLDHFVKKAVAGGMQVLVHAIGDAGVAATVSAFEKVIKTENPGRNIGDNTLRHGIIHCQITSAELLQRIARNKILALVQPIFLADDLPILESRVGPKLALSSYAWGSMHKLGIPVSFSTDAPVSPLSPLLNIEWAALRRDSEDPSSESFCPDEKVDVYTALDAYTAGSAFASFDESSLGRIGPGYMADLVFIDRDIFTIPPDEIHRANVLRTMCAGETVYSA